MNNKKLLSDFLTAGLITLVVSVIVNYLWGLIFASGGTIDWEESVRFAITIGAVLAWLKARAK